MIFGYDCDNACISQDHNPSFNKWSCFGVSVLLADTLTACKSLLSSGTELHRSTAGVAIAGDSEGGATDVRRGTGHDGTSGVLNDAQELLTFLRTDDRPAHFAVVYLH